MGVDKSKQKKNLLKKNYKECFIYYFDDKIWYITNQHLKKVNHIIDGSIKLEESQAYMHRYKKVGGDSLFKMILGSGTIDNYSNFGNTNKVIIVFDLPYRPLIKDIDLTRSYNKNAKLFKYVNDKHFPLYVDERTKKLNYYLKRSKKNEKEKVILRGKIKKNKTSTKVKYKNIVEADKLKLIGIMRMISENKNNIKELGEEIKRYPVEVWKDGKGVFENRLKVYEYLTKKFKALNNPNLVMDGAVAEGSNEFSSIELHSNIKTPGSQIGEGELGIMFYIKTKGYKNVFIHSTDTDTFTIAGLYYAIEGLGIDQNIFMRCKNWYYRKNGIGDNSNRIYIVDVKKLSNRLKSDFSNLEYPLLTFWVFWGILLGCDFISGVHKLIQINQRDITIDETLKNIFN